MGLRTGTPFDLGADSHGPCQLKRRLYGVEPIPYFHTVADGVDVPASLLFHELSIEFPAWLETDGGDHVSHQQRLFGARRAGLDHLRAHGHNDHFGRQTPRGLRSRE